MIELFDTEKSQWFGIFGVLSFLLLLMAILMVITVSWILASLLYTSLLTFLFCLSKVHQPKKQEIHDETIIYYDVISMKSAFDEVSRAFNFEPTIVKKDDKPAEVKSPFYMRINWLPISPMQAKQMFALKYFSRKLGVFPEYAIARNPESLDETWNMLKNMPKGARLEYGKDADTKKLVCRMLIDEVDCKFYIRGRSGGT